MERFLLQPQITPPKTEIYFGLDQLVPVCQEKKGLIVSDLKVAGTHGAVLQKALGFDLLPISPQKTKEAKEALEEEFLKRGLQKDSLLIAVGGGSLTDLTAFTASTYLRGIPLILIPTTLLGMVDAAIGGKTGIDTPFGKNLFGTFYLPQAVFIEVDFLKTLPDREWKNGLSEILKYGLIAEESIWERAQNWEKNIPFLIRASVQCKCQIVEADFEEKRGLRRILNFGHTVGHALELLSNYEMPHGEAVALGCMAESFLSFALGYLPEKTLSEILTLYRKLGYRFKEIDRDAFIQALARDKKGMFRFVLIDEIGRVLPFEGEYCQNVQPQAISQMIEWMCHG